MSKRREIAARSSRQENVAWQGIGVSKEAALSEVVPVVETAGYVDRPDPRAIFRLLRPEP